MAARVQGFAWPVSSAMPVPGRANRKASTPAVTPRGTSSSTAALSRLATAEEDRAAGPSGCSDILENWVVSWADKMCQALADAQLEASRPNSARGVSGMVPHSARNNRDGMNRRPDSFRASWQGLNSGGRGKGRQVGVSGRGRQQSDSDRRVGSKPSNGSPRVPLPPDSLAAVSALNKLERALQPYLQGAAGNHHSNDIEAFLSPRYTRASVYESSTSHDMRLGSNSHAQRQPRPSTQGQSQLRQTKLSVGGSPSSANASRRHPATRTSPVPPLSGMQRDGAAMRTGSSFGHSQSSRPSPSRQHHTAWPEHQGAASSSRPGSSRRFASPEKAAIMGSPRSSLMPEVITRSSLAAGNLAPASSLDASLDMPRARKGTGAAPESSWEAVNEEDSSKSPLQAQSLQTSPFDADVLRPCGIVDEQALQWRLDRMQSLILQAQQHTEEQQHFLRADFQELTRLRASEVQSSLGISGRCSNEDISSSDESSLVEDEPMGRLKS